MGARLMMAKMHEAMLHYVSPCWRWKNRVGRRKLGDPKALSIVKGSGLCQNISSPQDCRMQQMAPHFFILEGEFIDTHPLGTLTK